MGWPSHKQTQMTKIQRFKTVNKNPADGTGSVGEKEFVIKDEGLFASMSDALRRCLKADLGAKRGFTGANGV